MALTFSSSDLPSQAFQAEKVRFIFRGVVSDNMECYVVSQRRPLGTEISLDDDIGGSSHDSEPFIRERLKSISALSGPGYVASTSGQEADTCPLIPGHTPVLGGTIGGKQTSHGKKHFTITIAGLIVKQPVIGGNGGQSLQTYVFELLH
ncbi:hypothetical protein P7K49_008129 [Saguinus oedipus]|uniref:Uncharacterized protein n=1 Tax=Saguinus oedipus TaxID=9490 RepID=A0ABQ9VWU2_SAGOE|nr:hypothetical protein P7K49_008129 [Saguinus oedipus]